MRRYIQNSVLFFLGLLFVIIILFGIIDFYLNSKNNTNAIFVWGDSQTFQGVDFEELHTKTKKDIYVAAQHGAGVYDFLVFVQKVPKHAEVLISFSKPVFVRKKESDRNLSGFSWHSLKLLYQHNYSLYELYTIFKNNILPRKLFFNYTFLYPYSDSIVTSEELPLIKAGFKSIPNYLNDKQKLMDEGIKILKEKGCVINVIEFPFHPIVAAIENKSPIKPIIKLYKNSFIKKFTNIVIDTIQLDSSILMMYDYTHLNEKGAREVAYQVGNTINKKKSTHFYFVKWK